MIDESKSMEDELEAMFEDPDPHGIMSNILDELYRAHRNVKALEQKYADKPDGLAALNDVLYILGDMADDYK